MITDEFLKRNNLPSIFGGLKQILYSELRNKGTAYDYIDGLKEGKIMGLNQGTEATIKNIISAGKEKIMVTSDGKIIPFSNTLDELMSEPNIKANIKQFLYDDIDKRASRDINEFVKTELKIKNDGTLKDSEIIENYFKTNKKDIHEVLRTRLYNDDDNKFDYSQDIEYKKYLSKADKHIIQIQNKINNETKRIQKKQSITTSPMNSPDISKKSLSRTQTNQKKTIDEMQIMRDDLTLYRNTKSQLDIYKNKYDKYNDIIINIEEKKKDLDNTEKKWITDFTQNYKTKDTAILLTDKFNIYDIKNIRKLFPEEKTGTSIYDIIGRRTEQEIKATQSHLIKDIRSKPLGSNKIMDYIEVPSIKYDVEEMVKRKYKTDNLPQDVIKYIVESHKK